MRFDGMPGPNWDGWVIEPSPWPCAASLAGRMPWLVSFWFLVYINTVQHCTAILGMHICIVLGQWLVVSAAVPVPRCSC
jgi:hypothetical protein